MGDESKSGSSSKVPFFIGGLVIAAVVIVAVVMSGSPPVDEDTSSVADGVYDDGEDRQIKSSPSPEPEREPEPEPEVDQPEKAPRKGPERPGGPGIPYGQDFPIKEMVSKNSRWNPPRPLRLLVKQDGNRTEDEARARAEDARRRFTAGESSYALIRELSDPPRGIPRNLLEQYENLPADQASPVLPVDNGFVVFFGTPDAPPESEE